MERASHREAEEAKRLGLAMTDAQAEAWSAKEAAREEAEKKKAGKGPVPEVKVEPMDIDSDEAYLAYFSDVDDQAAVFLFYNYVMKKLYV